jgi:hypothetical protein
MLNRAYHKVCSVFLFFTEKEFMKRITQILCLFIFTVNLFAVGEAGAIFLLIAPGAGPAGTGEAQVAKADDAYASYYNPAGLGFLSGSEAAGMHVNWLPNLADDIYYDFLAYRREIAGIGSLGTHLIFLNLGSQVQTDADGNELGNFNSNMWAITTSLGTNLNETSSVGIGFKILQQNLGPGAGSEANEGKSTDFLFDVGYLKKYSFGNIGVSITNIGPKIWFQDQSQADPAPTNMRLGLFSNVYNDGFNKLNVMFDANKLLVSRYQEMDWNGDGLISGDDELAHDDSWYTAIFTSWLDDWYYGGDYNLDNDAQIGGYNWDDINGDSKINDGELNPTLEYDANSDGIYNEGDQFYDFNDEEYGIYGSCDISSSSGTLPEDCREKGSGDNRSFSTELEEMVYNMGAEYWYTDNFVLRGGYIYDKEGKITNPTFGAGIRFAQYGFDFGYTAGEQGHPRANTMFFSVNIIL